MGSLSAPYLYDPERWVNKSAKTSEEAASAPRTIAILDKSSLQDYISIISPRLMSWSSGTSELGFLALGESVEAMAKKKHPRIPVSHFSH